MVLVFWCICGLWFVDLFVELVCLLVCLCVFACVMVCLYVCMLCRCFVDDVLLL